MTTSSNNLEGKFHQPKEEIIQNNRTLYTEREASEYLRISTVTLWRERKKGKITFRRVASKIIYLQEDLENYLNQNKREAFSIKG